MNTKQKLLKKAVDNTVFLHSMTLAHGQVTKVPLTEFDRVVQAAMTLLDDGEECSALEEFSTEPTAEMPGPNSNTLYLFTVRELLDHVCSRYQQATGGEAYMVDDKRKR